MQNAGCNALVARYKIDQTVPTLNQLFRSYIWYDAKLDWIPDQLFHKT